MQIEQPLDLLTAKSIREHMDKHGLVRHKHRKTLMEILGLSESQAHRKLAGQAGWTLEEIKKVADYFRICPNAILNPIFTDTANEGILEIGEKEYPCLVWIGQELTEKGSHPLIAFQQDNIWRVSNVQRQTDAKIFAVNRIEFGPSPKISVAILDDDISFVESIAIQLRKFGFHASSYHDEKVFLNDMEHKEFDAFVIDWLLEKHTADKLISNMRRSKIHKHTPIILLTGNTEHYASDIATVIQEHRAIFLGKPVSSAIIAAQLKTILNIN